MSGVSVATWLKPTVSGMAPALQARLAVRPVRLLADMALVVDDGAVVVELLHERDQRRSQRPGGPVEARREGLWERPQHARHDVLLLRAEVATVAVGDGTQTGVDDGEVAIRAHALLDAQQAVGDVHRARFARRALPARF